VCKLWDVKRRHEPPADERVAELAGRCFYRNVEVASLRGQPVLRYHDAGVRLDLGSIAKGYGVDRAVHVLRTFGIEKAVVVAGGDLYALGTSPSGDPWSIGIQSPTDERAIVGTLELSDRAVATSGTYRQFFRYRGRRYHHIMDPATAQPRATAMQSLTVTADSVMHADASTTALFGMTESEITSVLSRQLSGARLERII
jgi:thiamine biosynthesis lipoprotein